MIAIVVLVVLVVAVKVVVVVMVVAVVVVVVAVVAAEAKATGSAAAGAQHWYLKCLSVRAQIKSRQHAALQGLQINASPSEKTPLGIMQAQAATRRCLQELAHPVTLLRPQRAAWMSWPLQKSPAHCSPGSPPLDSDRQVQNQNKKRGLEHYATASRQSGRWLIRPN